MANIFFKSFGIKEFTIAELENQVKNECSSINVHHYRLQLGRRFGVYKKSSPWTDVWSHIKRGALCKIVLNRSETSTSIAGSHDFVVVVFTKHKNSLVSCFYFFNLFACQLIRKGVLSYKIEPAGQKLRPMVRSQAVLTLSVDADVSRYAGTSCKCTELERCVLLRLLWLLARCESTRRDLSR